MARTVREISIAMGATQLPTGKLTFSHTRKVAAEIYGALAVHEEPEAWPGARERWNVTHIATGYAIAEGQSKARARKLAKKLQGFAWEKVTAEKGIRRWKDAKAVIAIVRAEAV